MSMLTCYFDASGSKHGTSVYSVAGYVSTEDGWIAFDRDWTSRLERFHVPHFHMKEFGPSKGHFKGWEGKDCRRAEFLEQLVRITRRYALHSFSVTMNLNVYEAGNRLFSLKERGVVPLLLCGGGCVEKALKWGKEKRRTEPIKFYFEKGELDWGILKKWMDDRGIPCDSAPKRPDPSKSLGFPLTPLQAADFVAWQLRRLYDDSVMKGLDLVRESLRGLMTIPHDWGCREVPDIVKFAKANNFQPRQK